MSKALWALVGLAFVVAACGGAQSPAVPQPASASVRAHPGSWMLPEAKTEALVYANDNDTNVNVYSYKTGELVGKITGLTDAYGECSDSNGNVFVTNSYHSNSTYEYAHGETKVKATFDTPGYYPQSCAWDPTTGNLAICATGSNGIVAVFANEQGQPTTYTSPIGVVFCTYDNRGNLFLDGGYNSNEELAELPKGSGTFVTIPLNQGWFWGSLQWDGEYLALDVPTGRPKGSPSTVYQIAVSGSKASIVGKTLLYGRHGDHNYQVDCQLWIHNRTILAGQKSALSLAAWRYPAGGKPRLVFKPANPTCGITLSVVPKQS